jgi:hypothetical protein
MGGETPRIAEISIEPWRVIFNNVERLDRLFIQAVRVQSTKEFPIADSRISLRRRMEIYGISGGAT